MRTREGIATLIVAFVIVLVPRSAAADDEPFTIGSRPAWYLMAGATSGGTIASTDDHKSAFVGGELSFVRVREGRFIGFYGDGYYDFGIKGAYTTGGLELGYKFIGIDGGGALRIDHGRVAPGATGRLFFTIGILSIYGRYLYINDAFSENEHVVQLGGLLKFPILSPLGAR